jgi:hypothetical protein
MPQSLQARIDDIAEMHFIKPYRVNGWSPFSGSSLMDGTGTWRFIGEQDNNARDGDTASGHYFEQDSPSEGEVACFTTDGVVGTGTKFSTVVMLSVGQTDNQRCFIGYTDQSLTDTLSADDPSSSNLFGFQQRAGESNWWICTKNASSDLTRFDTTVPVSADTVLKFLLYSDGGSGASLKWAIRDSNSVLLAGASTASTPPTSTVIMRFVAGMEATTASVKQIRQYGAIEYT